MTASILPKQLAELHRIEPSTGLIDVRMPAEFRAMHVDFARNVPLDRLNPNEFAAERNGRANETLYVICQSGSRGKLACEKLVAAGLNAVNVEGGTLAWVAAGLPVVRGKKSISLERQVRIAIGLIVLTSSLLATFVHPYWIGLAAFMGAGLVFSGITDFCGLALILGRMPWNQVTVASGDDDHGRTTMCCSPAKK
jgi:rhodanese-related sulfurtransferase